MIDSFGNFSTWPQATLEVKLPSSEYVCESVWTSIAIERIIKYWRSVSRRSGTKAERNRGQLHLLNPSRWLNWLFLMNYCPTREQATDLANLLTFNDKKEEKERKSPVLFLDDYFVRNGRWRRIGHILIKTQQ